MTLFCFLLLSLFFWGCGIVTSGRKSRSQWRALIQKEVTGHFIINCTVLITFKRIVLLLLKLIVWMSQYSPFQ
jgi:hypothetical protein